MMAGLGCPHTSSKTAADIVRQNPGDWETQNHRLAATLQAAPPPRGRTGAELTHKPSTPEPVQPTPSFPVTWPTCPVSTLGPGTMAPSLLWSLVHVAQRARMFLPTVPRIWSPRPVSDSLRCADVLKAAACFITDCPPHAPHQGTTPHPNNKLLALGHTVTSIMGWEVRAHGRVLCAPEACVSFPRQLPGLIRC